MVDAQHSALVSGSLVDLPLGALFAHTRPSIPKQSLRAPKERARDLVEPKINDQSNRHLNDVRDLKLSVEVKVVPNTISARALSCQGVCVSRNVLTIQDR